MGLKGFEPLTLRLSSACSNQLSYRPGPTTAASRKPTVVGERGLVKAAVRFGVCETDERRFAAFPVALPGSATAATMAGKEGAEAAA